MTTKDIEAQSTTLPTQAGHTPTKEQPASVDINLVLKPEKPGHLSQVENHLYRAKLARIHLRSANSLQDLKNRARHVGLDLAPYHMSWPRDTHEKVSVRLWGATVGPWESPTIVVEYRGAVEGTLIIDSAKQAMVLERWLVGNMPGLEDDLIVEALRQWEAQHP